MNKGEGIKNNYVKNYKQGHVLWYKRKQKWCFFTYGISLNFQKVSSKWHLSIQSCHLLVLNGHDSHVTLNEIEQAQVGLDMLK
jgi:hypothetical protein